MANKSEEEEEEKLLVDSDDDSDNTGGDNFQDEEQPPQQPQDDSESEDEEEEKKEEVGHDEDSSASEYSEPMFPENVGGSGDEGSDDDGSMQFGVGSTLSGSSFHSGKSYKSNNSQFNASGNISVASSKQVEVTPQVWARTWEDRVQKFKEEHPKEYANVERQMKQKDIMKIAEERSQRIYENKLFKNVDRFCKITGGALCAWFCCTIILIIVLAVILKPDDYVSPAPTPPPYSVNEEGQWNVVVDSETTTPAPTPIQN